MVGELDCDEAVRSLSLIIKYTGVDPKKHLDGMTEPASHLGPVSYTHLTLPTKA